MDSKLKLTSSFLVAALALHLSSASFSAERLKLHFPGISFEDVRIHFIFGEVKNANEGAKPPRKVVPPGELDP
jgi:hypothetical protein